MKMVQGKIKKDFMLDNNVKEGFKFGVKSQ